MSGSEAEWGTKLARAIHFDESDSRVYPNPARTGEWCIAGTFEFSDWMEADLVGRARQAFSNGWLGLETFGRATLVAVARVEPREVEALEAALARHFVDLHGAPSEAAALPVARSEIAAMADLCGPLDPNTVLMVARELTEAGVRESVRIVAARDADLAQIAVHGD